MTKREGAILSVYTGIMLCNFHDLHVYAEELFGGPLFTYTFGSASFAAHLKIKSEADFKALMESLK